jgi:hypothetical protein
MGFATDIGYARAVHISSEGLGDANFNAGDLDAAEAAYLEALRAVEQMSMVREMSSTIVKIAKTRAAKGDGSSAVELLFVVLKENTSDERGLFEDTPVVELARDAMFNLEREMGADEHKRAQEAAAARSYGDVIRDLTTARATLR